MRPWWIAPALLMLFPILGAAQVQPDTINPVDGTELLKAPRNITLRANESTSDRTRSTRAEYSPSSSQTESPIESNHSTFRLPTPSSALSTSSFSEAPRTISYQGILKNASGSVAPDGEYSITLRLYGDSTGTQEVWRDVFNVQVREGVFNILLGSGPNPLPASAELDRPLWISMQIGADEEIRPFSPLSAVPFALNVSDKSITANKISADYIRSLSINGQTLTGNGVDLSIQTGEGISAAVDPTTGAIMLRGSGIASGNESKGDVSQGNTTISGSLVVTGGTTVGTSITVSGNGTINGNGSIQGSTTLGSNNADSIIFNARGGSHLNMGGYNITNVGILSADSIKLGRAISASNGGTGLTSYSTGDMLYASSSNTLAKLGIGASGQIMTISGGLPVWSSSAYPTTTSANQLLFSSASNTVTGLATANNGILLTSANGAPSIGSTLPNAVQDNITRLGTVTSWGSTVVPIANGGTGATTSAGALKALTPDTTGQTGKYLTVQPGGGIGWATGGGGGGSGTVTSIDVSGGTTGLTTSGGAVTTSGTITLSGTVNETHGGTGQTSYTAGDILYASASNTLSKLPKGSTGDVLTVINGLPAWQGASTTTFGADGPTFADIGGIAAATQGGTGNSGYVNGDIIYFKSGQGDKLSRLAVGATGKVLGVASANTPGYIENGATITNTVNTPSALTGNTNDYVVDGSSTYIRLNNTTGGVIDLTGISASGVVNGRNITLVNISASTTDGIVIRHQSNQSSSGNQFELPGASDIILGQRGTATFIYDAAVGHWTLVTTN